MEVSFNTHYSPLLDREWPDVVKTIQAMDEETMAETRLFKGHMRMGLHELIPVPTTYFTFFREQMERAFSYYYMLQWRKDRGIDGIDPRLPDWNIRHPALLEEWDNGMTRSLADIGREVPFGRCRLEHFEKARENLEKHFFFIGLMEQFDLSLLLLGRLCGWSWHLYVPKNTKPEGTRELSADIKEALRDLNSWYARLYQWAQERFFRQVTLQGQGLLLEQKAYTWLNRRHQALHEWRKKNKEETACANETSPSSTDRE